MQVRLPIDDTFSFIGYVDGLNPHTKQLLEIKTGSRWSKQRFLDLVQWKLYAAALPDYAEVVFVNCSLTQWFERARFEYHAGRPVGSQVVFGRIGDELKQLTVR